jgi:phytoene/squalene synthetase
VISDVARPCAIFSYLVHIIRDFQKDQFNNLNYFAQDILEKHGLTAEQLKLIATGGEIPDGFRGVISEYKIQAEKYKVETEKMLKSLEGKLEPRDMLSLKIIYHLYLQIYNRIDPDHGRFTMAELNPTPDEVKESVAECIRSYFSQNNTDSRLKDPGFTIYVLRS